MPEIDIQMAKAQVGEPARQLGADPDKLLGEVRAVVEAPTALPQRAKSEVEPIAQRAGFGLGWQRRW